MFSECPLVVHCHEMTVFYNCLCIHIKYSVFSFNIDCRAEVQYRLHQDQEYPCEVVGSWNTWYGEQDQAGKQQ